MFKNKFAFITVLILVFSSLPLMAADAAGAVFFVSTRDGSEQIYVMNPLGGGQTRLTNRADYFFSRPSLSPDAREILFSGGEYDNDEDSPIKDLYIMDAGGNSMRRITNGKFVKDYGAWFPDGKKIVFSSKESGRFGLCVAGSNGGENTKLTGGDFDDISPAVSPDGGRIAFESNKAEENVEQEEGDMEGQDNADYDPIIPDGRHVLYNNDEQGKIYIMDADGKNRKRLTNETGRQSTPFWSVDGKKLFYFSGDDGGEMAVCRMDPDGKNQEVWARISNDARAGSVAWVNGGKNLIFAAVENGGRWRELYAMDGQFNPVSPMTAVESDNYDPCFTAINYQTSGLWDRLKPLFSGKKGKIAFLSARDGGMNIYTMDPDGAFQKKLTESNTAGHPDLSPDREKVAYIDYAPAPQIFITNADGTDKKTLTNDTVYKDCPKWSPDGKKILFSGSAEGKPSEIYVINADGTGIRKLTNDSFYDNEPSWSPDGKKIVFASTRGPNGKIFVIDADGKNQKQLTFSTDKENDDTPCWSPDGSKILFSRNYVFMTMNPDGSGQKKLKCEMTGWEGVWSPDGRKIAFRPSNANESVYVMNADGSKPADITNSAPQTIEPSWK